MDKSTNKPLLLSDLKDLPDGLKRRKMGRPSIVSKNPAIVEKVNNIIRQGSAAAHSRRRDDTAVSHGLSRKQIQKRLKEDMGVEVSVDTIHRMMMSPNKSHRAACRYKGLVNAKVPPKSNSQSARDHVDFHYTAAQVNFLNEMAEFFRDEVISLSCDDKNKLNIGTPAVSRHVKYQAFFNCQQQPDLPDHDFPLPNAKLTPSGYMVLGDNTCDKGCSYHKDECDRSHVTWGRVGQMHVYLHSDTFFPSTSQMHLNHLVELIPQLTRGTGQTVVSIICDGGPDWRTDSPCNIINYGRLWRDLQLDGLFLSTYAPYHSRYNPIERAFSNLTKWLTGVIFPAVLPGEDKPPQQQSISATEKQQKLMEVHDNAMLTCSQYWSERQWNGHPITVHRVPCSGETLRYRDHASLTELSSAPLYALKGKLQSEVQEYRFILKHLVRSTYQLQFFKCAEKSCQHCSSLPVKATKVMGYLRNHNNRVPLPTWSADCAGHYRTFLDTLNAPSNSRPGFEENLPSGGTITGCTKSQCRYIPASAADAKRHERLVHRKLY